MRQQEEKEENDVSPRVCRAAKRTFDLLFTAVMVTVAVPVMGIVCFLALLTQGVPLFYVSRRYISPTNAVKIYKFRTMAVDAATPKYRLQERFMRDGYLDIPIDCEVYTPFGRFLERTQIVELPQLLNVLLDRMSWVGNRALPAENIRLLSQFKGWEERFDSPCGLTGLSQVVGKLNLTPLQRITLECGYASVYKHGNVVKCDLLILLATLRLILTGRFTTYEEAIALITRCM